MNHLAIDLQALVTKGKAQGFLTYDEVNAYLPDQDVSPEKLDNLLIALDEQGIELVDQPPVLSFEDHRPTKQQPESTMETISSKDLPKASDDPIRMYLSQMADIPLLSRDEEIALAKKIEVTRKRFRRTLLACDFAMRDRKSVV